MAYRGVLERPPSFSTQLARNLGTGLSAGLSKSAETLANRYAEKKQHEQLSSYAERLAQEHPNDLEYQRLATALQTPLPIEQKVALAKSLMGAGDPFRSGQQKRLEQEAVLRRYNGRIKEVDEELNNFVNRADPEHLKKLKELKKALQTERDQLLGFEALQEREPEMEENRFDFDFDFEEPEKPTKKAAKKPRFDLQNPKHRKMRDAILKQAKGDREKAEKILLRHFE